MFLKEYCLCHHLKTFIQCCDRKSRAAHAQSFTLWQQATIEFTCHDHSITACSRQIYVVLFLAHIPFVVNCAFSATPTERLQQQLAFFARLFFNFFRSALPPCGQWPLGVASFRSRFGLAPGYIRRHLRTERAASPSTGTLQ